MELFLGLEASPQAEHKMDDTVKESYPFRGRQDERELAARDLRESFNDRRQRERYKLEKNMVPVVL